MRTYSVGFTAEVDSTAAIASVGRIVDLSRMPRPRMMRGETIAAARPRSLAARCR